MAGDRKLLIPVYLNPHVIVFDLIDHASRRDIDSRHT